ncbi:ndufaf3 [Scenedesmus sp. PABB004]|nr:ndufaf3 [Scenedesmus sp. PABB004]
MLRRLLQPGAAAWQQQQRRAASTLSSVIAPETGKTKLQGYLPHAFLINGVQAEGAVLCLPESWLLWDVAAFADVTPAALAVLDLVDPPPEVLVLGCGAAMRRLPAHLAAHLAARGIAAEVLDTRNALSYFNFLNDEGRSVVAALLPAGVGADADGS